MLIDNNTKKEYYALYYEAKYINKNNINKEECFIIGKNDIADFLEEKLEILGLNAKERQEFIIYWLPKLQANKYVYIRFQSQEEIERNMPLILDKIPDTLIRVMMEWKGLNKKINVKEQNLTKVTRKGFTIVEWGKLKYN